MTKPNATISAQEVMTALGVEKSFLLSLHREHIVTTEYGTGYEPATVERIRVCQTLHLELGVNFAGLEVALRLLETLHAQRVQFSEVLSWLRDRLDGPGPR